MLRLTPQQYRRIVAHCLDAERDPETGLLYEACGLLGGLLDADGAPTGKVTGVYPCRNADASAKTYTVDSRDYMPALRDAEAHGGSLVGVWHSHTHTAPIPRRPTSGRRPTPAGCTPS